MSDHPGASDSLKRKGFFGYDPGLEEEIFAFQRDEYPQRDPDRAAPHWRWMFVASAARLGLKPYVWLYRKDNAVVAHQGAIPVRLHAGDEEVVTGWFVETMASRKVRGSPIGPMLIKKALEDMPLNLSLGQTSLMRELQYAMGWKHVCALTKYVFVSGYRMDLRNKLPPGIAEIAAAGLGMWHNLRLKWRRRSGLLDRHFSFVERFTEEHDELWREMSETSVCAVVRDASYLNWKYADRPFNTFKLIEMREADRVAGIVVVMSAEPNAVYGHKRGFLVDFVVPLNRPDSIAALICKGIEVLKSEGAETVTCQMSSHALGAILEKLGFMAREPRHQFLVSVGGRGQASEQLLTNPGNWFLTLGDSDADAYAD